MNARTAVLRVIHEDDGTAVAEDTIFEKFPDGEYRTVKAALQGLADADVIRDRRVFGGERWWYINHNVGERELRQALESVGPGEVAELAIEQSAILGDPKTARRDRGEFWKDLL